MRKHLIAPVLMISLLAGCSGTSGWNPSNWFKSTDENGTVQVIDGQEVLVLKTLAPNKGYGEFVETRPLAPNLTALNVARAGTGAIVTATTVVPSLGYYDAQLVRTQSARGDTLTLEYRIKAPSDAQGTGTPAQRQITAAYKISSKELANIRTIIVRSATGTRQVRR